MIITMRREATSTWSAWTSTAPPRRTPPARYEEASPASGSTPAASSRSPAAAQCRGTTSRRWASPARAPGSASRAPPWPTWPRRATTRSPTGSCCQSATGTLSTSPSWPRGRSSRSWSTPRGSWGKHKPDRIKPGRVKRSALYLQNQSYYICCFLIRPHLGLWGSSRATITIIIIITITIVIIITITISIIIIIICYYTCSEAPAGQLLLL